MGCNIRRNTKQCQQLKFTSTGQTTLTETVTGPFREITSSASSFSRIVQLWVSPFIIVLGLLYIDPGDTEQFNVCAMLNPGKQQAFFYDSPSYPSMSFFKLREFTAVNVLCACLTAWAALRITQDNNLHLQDIQKKMCSGPWPSHPSHGPCINIFHRDRLNMDPVLRLLLGIKAVWYQPSFPRTRSTS